MIVYELEFAPTDILRDPLLELRPRRECVIKVWRESDTEGAEQCLELTFFNTIAYKCTFLPAITSTLRGNSYGAVVLVDNSPWLKEASVAIMRRNINMPEIKHLKITFDDGPCYEFLCTDFSHHTSEQGENSGYEES